MVSCGRRFLHPGLLMLRKWHKHCNCESFIYIAPQLSCIWDITYGRLSMLILKSGEPRIEPSSLIYGQKCAQNRNEIFPTHKLTGPPRLARTSYLQARANLWNFIWGKIKIILVAVERIQFYLTEVCRPEVHGLKDSQTSKSSQRAARDTVFGAVSRKPSTNLRTLLLFTCFLSIA